MKSFVSLFIGLLTEFRKDTKAASILVMFGMLIGAMYVLWGQVEENNELSRICETQLTKCQDERIREIKDMQAKVLEIAFKNDSLNRLKKR